MLVNLVVQSDLSAPANGLLQISIDSNQPVGNLISKFCEDKQIEKRSQYCLVDTHNRVLNSEKTISHYGIKTGDRILFCSSHEKAQQYQSWNFIAITAVVFSLIGFVICLAIFLGFVRTPDSYAVVLDAGSTHTEVLVYRWPGNKLNNTGLVVQVQACSIKGGIGELTEYSEVPAYLQRCLEEAKATIPSESLEHSEVFFGATAGLRILNEVDHQLADNILQEVRYTLASSGLIFKNKHARILTGSEEGASGWLTVNYLNENLLKQASPWGALDLGGASTQISFELNETQPMPKNESLMADFQVYGRKVKVFSKSYLCYGLYQSELRYRAHLILQQRNLEEKVSSPCEHVGYTFVFKGSQIFGSSCSPVPTDSSMIKRNYTFAGTSDVDRCASTVKYLLNETFCRDYNLKDCVSLEDLPAGFHDINYMAFSAFGHINQSLGLPRNTTSNDYENAIRNECSMTLGDLLNHYIQNDEEIKVRPRMLQSTCFKRYFMFTLIHDMYQFNTDEKWSKINFGLTVRGKSLGWALGFMVNETQSIAAAPSIYGMNTIVFVLLVILFSAFLIVSISFVIYVLKSRKSLNRSYRSLDLATA